MYGYQGGYGPYGNQSAQQGNSAYQNPTANLYAAASSGTAINAYPNFTYGGVQQLPQQVPRVADAYTASLKAYSQYSNPYNASQQIPQPPPPPPSLPSSQKTYQGYDSAVFAAANSYLASKNSGTTKQWMSKGGGGYRKYSSGPRDSQIYFCEICKISCAGGVTYKEHLEGKQHKKKEAGEKAIIPKNRLGYRCDLCEVLCAGQDSYAAHVRGSKHVKAVALLKKLGKTVPEDVPTIISNTENGITETKAKSKWHQQQLPGSKRVVGINTVNFVGGSQLNSTGRLEEKKKEVMAAVGSVGKPEIEVEDEHLKALMAAEEVKPIGEEHIVEQKDATGKIIQYVCQICNCSFSDPNAIDVHLKGKRHRTSYKQKIDPNFRIEPKTVPKRTPIEKKLSTPLMKSPWFSQPTPDGLRWESIDERTYEEKHKSLFPGDEFMAGLEKVVYEAEEALKSVSEELERRKPNGVKIEDESDQRPRTLQGLMRIGNLAKNTCISGDDTVSLVILCTPPPTTELVSEVIEIFKEKAPTLTIETDPTSGSCLFISSPRYPTVRVRFMMTSPTLRDMVEPFECVDKERCLLALALLRRSKWFTARCLYLKSCQSVLRVLRDLRNRDSIWRLFDDHTLDLFVEKVIASSPIALSAVEAFKRVFEAISAGALYSVIIYDPCEKQKIDVIDNISMEDKDRITEHVQNQFRLIAFNQLYKVLNIDRLPEVRQSLKRPNTDNGSNSDIVLKREKLEGEDDEPEQNEEIEQKVKDEINQSIV